MGNQLTVSFQSYFSDLIFVWLFRYDVMSVFFGILSIHSIRFCIQANKTEKLYIFSPSKADCPLSCSRWLPLGLQKKRENRESTLTCLPKWFVISNYHLWLMCKHCNERNDCHLTASIPVAFLLGNRSWHLCGSTKQECGICLLLWRRTVSYPWIYVATALWTPWCL